MYGSLGPAYYKSTTISRSARSAPPWPLDRRFRQNEISRSPLFSFPPSRLSTPRAYSPSFKKGDSVIRVRAIQRIRAIDRGSELNRGWPLARGPYIPSPARGVSSPVPLAAHFCALRSPVATNPAAPYQRVLPASSTSKASPLSFPSVIRPTTSHGVHGPQRRRPWPMGDFGAEADCVLEVLA